MDNVQDPCPWPSPGDVEAACYGGVLLAGRHLPCVDLRRAFTKRVRRRFLFSRTSMMKTSMGGSVEKETSRCRGPSRGKTPERKMRGPAARVGLRNGDRTRHGEPQGPASGVGWGQSGVPRPSGILHPQCLGIVAWQRARPQIVRPPECLRTIAYESVQSLAAQPACVSFVTFSTSLRLYSRDLVACGGRNPRQRECVCLSWALKSPIQRVPALSTRESGRT